MLELLSLLVHAVPRHAERLGEVELEQAVVAQHRERHPYPGAREPDAVVGLGRHVESLRDRGRGHRSVGALADRPDRLRVVLDGVRDLAGVAARGGHQSDTISPVRYITVSPVSRPATPSGCSRRPAPSRMAGAIWTTTCAMAPAPTPNMSAARLGLKADAPIQAPSTAGAPARSPSSASRRSRACRSCATGATIASPSVVLWSANPTTSVAPRASEPTA